MAKITGILCQVITGDVDGASTDGSVYLGLGGREFRLDSEKDDYERGSWREYILGAGPQEPNLPPPQIRVRNPERNDPRVGHPLDTINLSRSPVYIRFEPEGSGEFWNLSFAAALVYSGQFVVGYTPPAGFADLWLGQAMGKILYLTDEWGRGPQALLDVGREVAARIGKHDPSR
jgi:hypothetical protein